MLLFGPKYDVRIPLLPLPIIWSDFGLSPPFPPEQTSFVHAPWSKSQSVTSLQNMQLSYKGSESLFYRSWKIVIVSDSLFQKAPNQFWIKIHDSWFVLSLKPTIDSKCGGHGWKRQSYVFAWRRSRLSWPLEWQWKKNAQRKWYERQLIEGVTQYLLTFFQSLTDNACTDFAHFFSSFVYTH